MGIFDFFKKDKNIINYKDGLNEIYYNNGKGKLKERYYNKNRQKNGLYQLYYEDGKTIKEEGNYRPGSRDDFNWSGESIEIGLHKIYYKNGKIKSITDYGLGNLDTSGYGESYKEYCEKTGKIRFEFNKQEDFKKEYYSNGQIKGERPWDSVYPIKEYSENGVLKSIKNSNKHQFFNKQGKLIDEKEIKVDKRIRTFKFDEYGNKIYDEE